MTNPASVTLPPPVSPVRFWMIACVPLKVTVPLAFERPLGMSSMLNEAFCICRRPLTTGLSVVPVTAAFRVMPPEEKIFATEGLEDLELHVAVGAQVERLGVGDRCRAGERDVGERADDVGALDGDDVAVERGDDRRLRCAARK